MERGGGGYVPVKAKVKGTYQAKYQFGYEWSCQYK